jgi:hypothetical protein
MQYNAYMNMYIYIYIYAFNAMMGNRKKVKIKAIPLTVRGGP